MFDRVSFEEEKIIVTSKTDKIQQGHREHMKKKVI